LTSKLIKKNSQGSFYQVILCLFKEASDKVLSKFFWNSSDLDDENHIPDFNEQNLKLLEQMFSTAIFQAPLLRDLELMVN
jgi:hypothetical protein